MAPNMGKMMMRLRMESKKRENQGKPPIDSPDIAQTADFAFSEIQHDGDSGQLLAKRKSTQRDQYLVKHEFSDCACNDFIYTKLAQAMGYCMPDAVLFQLSPGEKRSYFKTEYIIGERYLNVIDSAPTYETVREQAKNWTHYFAFCSLYAITGEGDGIEILLADDHKIYRVDTTDAFPISNYQLEFAGINQEMDGYVPYNVIKEQLLSANFSGILDGTSCDWMLEQCAKINADSRSCFFRLC